jgi:hypothetical protein
MFAQTIARRLDPSGRRFASQSSPVRRTALRRAALLLLLACAAGCTAAPPAPLAGPDASDPHARPVGYRPVVGPYASGRPADPAAWRERNERVAPPEKP